MRADLTRDTFDPAKHYCRVIQQQGRVTLESDWNELTSIFLYYMRALARDLIGAHGAPAVNAGFQVVTDPALIRGPGGQPLADAARLQQLKDLIAKGDFVIGPGRYYVEGILIENAAPIAYSEQAGLGPDTVASLKFPYLVYVDVWERFVTAAEDDTIREVALGGCDTTARSQIAWAVRTMAPLSTSASCDDVLTLPPIGTGRLRARARQDRPQTDLCVISPGARYRGPENQLYRVEIHQGGAASATGNGATWKWSRENGSVTLPVDDVATAGASQVTVTLAAWGRDSHLAIEEGDWVELVDDTYVAQNRADALLQVARIDRDNLVVTLDGTTKVTNAGRHILLRRWDQDGTANLGGALPVVEHPDTAAGLKEAWTPLEDGIQIWFAAGGQYRTGDYWLIPARTATGDVVWPHDLNADGTERLDDNGNPIGAERPPDGPRHYYAPLARRTGPQTAGNAPDCRCMIQPITKCPT